MGFELPQLPYDYNALEPHIDARTMEIHHGKHHAGYTTKLNTALDAEGVVVTDINMLMSDLNGVPDSIRGAVRNNGGGYVNHCLFWEIMAPNAGGEPTGSLANDINATFGNFANFKQKFSDAAATRFGSGWAWLVVKNGKLHVTSTANQDSPLSEGEIPILGLDVWEHAYYLNYQNKRPDYVSAWWNVVNWNVVADKYAAAIS